MRIAAILLAFMLGLLPLRLAAQQATAFVQIEALPTLGRAQSRARAYANAFPNVNGFRLGGGWYAIALGPFTAAGAQAELQALRRERLIPNDSYIVRAPTYRERFFPEDGAAIAAATPAREAETPTGTTTQASQTPEPQREETLAEARRSEGALDLAGRKALQEALQWEGFYRAGIDGAFGRGTRGAMGAWQVARGYRATGVLTTRQREELLLAYKRVFDDLSLSSVRDDDAGIEIVLPMGKITFARAEAPFVQYDASDNDGLRVLLISQTGDEATLFGLYDIMQTLEIVPESGDRTRRPRNFTLTGQSDTLHSHTYAEVTAGAVKGFTLIWDPTKQDDPRVMERVLKTMQDSFRPIRGVILPDTAVSGDGSDQRIDLLAGLEIRTPERSRTGFFVDGAGNVLTASEAVAQCKRVTLGNELEAEVTVADSLSGLALLKPRNRLAPLAVATFQQTLPRLQSEIAVAGFSYGQALDLPVLTFGRLADVRGLSGETDMQRLDLAAQPGDTGGPVFDQTGAVVGMLRPAPDTSQRMPDRVSFAVNAPTISGFLVAAGLTPAPANGATALAPEDIATLAESMTIRVSCWN